MAEVVQVAVPVESAATSKINWTQLTGLAVSVSAWAGLHLDPKTLVQVIIGIQALQSIITIIWKTWFTASVTPASAAIASAPILMPKKK